MQTHTVYYNKQLAPIPAQQLPYLETHLLTSLTLPLPQYLLTCTRSFSVGNLVPFLPATRIIKPVEVVVPRSPIVVCSFAVEHDHGDREEEEEEEDGDRAAV